MKKRVFCTICAILIVFGTIPAFAIPPTLYPGTPWHRDLGNGLVIYMNYEGHLYESERRATGLYRDGELLYPIMISLPFESTVWVSSDAASIIARHSYLVSERVFPDPQGEFYFIEWGWRVVIDVLYMGESVARHDGVTVRTVADDNALVITVPMDGFRRTIVFDLDTHEILLEEDVSTDSVAIDYSSDGDSFGTNLSVFVIFFIKNLLWR